MMQTVQVHSVAATATRLRRLNPEAAALDVLDGALRGHPADTLAFPPELVVPSSAFGQLLAEAFDPDMTAAEWADWAGECADHPLRDALLRAWSSEILPRFTSRYGLPAIRLPIDRRLQSRHRQPIH